MEHFNWLIRPPKDEFREGPFPDGMVETFGHVPYKEQVDRLNRAGVRLVVRRIQFEFGAEDEIPEDWINITAQPDFDIFEAHRVLRDIREQRKFVTKGHHGGAKREEVDDEGRAEEAVPDGGAEPPDPEAVPAA